MRTLSGRAETGLSLTVLGVLAIGKRHFVASGTNSFPSSFPRASGGMVPDALSLIRPTKAIGYP